MKNLIIVESPTKARTLSRFLGSDYQVEATMGHIRDLPLKKMGVNTDGNFEPDYVLVAGKKELVDKLKDAAKKADKIYLATDPDREGEAIAWHVAEILSETEKQKNRKTEKSSLSSSVFQSFSSNRIVFHEITKSAIEHAITNPRAIDMALVNAQQARRILDRIVGYKLSPLLWFKVRKGLSAGRVQSVVVRLIVEREREIEKFVPIEYWEISADLKKRLGSKLPDAPLFNAKLTQKNGDKLEIHNQSETEIIVNELKDAGYEIKSVDKKEVRRSSGAPFTTSTIQQQASNRLGWPAKRTMRVAQSLYEKGLITYHRTDSTNLAVEAVDMVRAYILEKYGNLYLPVEPKLYKTKSKVAQEAHEAIRPTGMAQASEIGDQITDKDEFRLYDLIWKKFVSCQMTDALFDETKVAVLATGQTNYFIFETTGKIMKFTGWMNLYGKEEGDEDGEINLPDLKVADELNLEKINDVQKFTLPPPRYTEASLIKILEEYGIGRPSTYAPTISTIQDRQYVEKTEGKFSPTPLGKAVNDFIMEYFKDIVDFQFTAKMEDNLDEIANGEKDWVPVLSEFYGPFNEKLSAVSKIAERVPIEVETTGENCPECGSPLVVRIGKFGKFVACSKFPDCKFTKPYLKEAGFVCPKCGAPVVMKKTKKGKTFFGCSKWPDCEFAAWKKPKTEGEPETLKTESVGLK